MEGIVKKMFKNSNEKSPVLKLYTLLCTLLCYKPSFLLNGSTDIQGSLEIKIFRDFSEELLVWKVMTKEST